MLVISCSQTSVLSRIWSITRIINFSIIFFLAFLIIILIVIFNIVANILIICLLGIILLFFITVIIDHYSFIKAPIKNALAERDKIIQIQKDALEKLSTQKETIINNIKDRQKDNLLIVHDQNQNMFGKMQNISNNNSHFLLNDETRDNLDQLLEQQNKFEQLPQSVKSISYNRYYFDYLMTWLSYVLWFSQSKNSTILDFYLIQETINRYLKKFQQNNYNPELLQYNNNILLLPNMLVNRKAKDICLIFNSKTLNLDTGEHDFDTTTNHSNGIFNLGSFDGDQIISYIHYNGTPPFGVDIYGYVMVSSLNNKSRLTILELMQDSNQKIIINKIYLLSRPRDQWFCAIYSIMKNGSFSRDNYSKLEETLINFFTYNVIENNYRFTINLGNHSIYHQYRFQIY